ncbi:hypothetical protein [Nostoc sp.]
MQNHFAARTYEITIQSIITYVAAIAIIIPSNGTRRVSKNGAT